MDYGQIYEVFNVLGFSEGFVATTVIRSGIVPGDYSKFLDKINKKSEYFISKVRYICGYPVSPMFYPGLDNMTEEQISWGVYMRIKDVEDVVSLKVDGPQLHMIRKAVWKEINKINIRLSDTFSDYYKLSEEEKTEAICERYVLQDVLDIIDETIEKTLKEQSNLEI